MKPPPTVLCLFFAPGPHSAVAILSLAEACYRFTPLIAVRGAGTPQSDAIFLDVSATLHLFEAIPLKRRLEALSHRFGLHPRITVAEDAPTALALARSGAQTPEQLSIETLEDFLSPFQPLSQDPVSQKQCANAIAKLRDLGLRSLQEFLELPHRAILSRFGLSVLQAAQRIRKSRLDAWPYFHLPEKIEESTDLGACDTLAPCADLEPLLFALRPALDRAFARLRARALRLASFQLRFQLQHAPARSWTFELPHPQGATPSVLSLIREKLSGVFQQQPLTAPVESIHLTVLETAPGQGAQSHFFHQKWEENEAWDSLMGRLVQKLGSGSVFQAALVASHRPEDAWSCEEVRLPERSEASETAVCEEYRRCTHSLVAERPLRLLPQPKTLWLQPSGELLSGNPTQSWQPLSWEGPERISLEWWFHASQLGHTDARVRDYFRVRTRAGQDLWVFRQGQGPQSQLFLHGFFD